MRRWISSSVTPALLLSAFTSWGSAGCLVLPGLPEGFVASCEVDDDCTTPGHICLPQGVCGVRPPPLPDATLNSSVITPARGGLTTRFEVTLSLTGEVLVAPEVGVDIGGGRRDLPLDDERTAPENGLYGYTYLPRGDEAEGDRTLFVTLLHQNGNTTEDLALGSIHFDFSPPAVAAAAVAPALLGPEDVVTLDVRFEEPLGEGSPTAWATAADGAVTALVLDDVTTPDDSEPSYRFSAPSTSLSQDGPYLVTVSAIDVDDNAHEVEVGGFVRDTTPAAYTASDVVLSPEPGNPLLAPTALRVGGQAVVVVTFSEAVTRVGGPALDCPGSTVEANLTVTDGNPMILQAALTAVSSPAELTCAWTVEVEDAAGNLTSVDVALVPLDTLAPAAAEIDATLFRHVRVPWGADVTGGTPMQQIVPLDDALTAEPPPVPAGAFSTFPTLRRLQAFSGDSAAAVLLAQSEPTAGGFTPLLLQSADSSEVWLSVVDGAGNASERVRVDEVEWVATLVGNEEGPTVQNPNRLTQVQVFRGYPLDASAIDVAHQGTLGAVDGSSLRVESVLRAEPPRRPGPAGAHTLAIDPLRGRWYALDAQGVWTLERDNAWAFDSSTLPGTYNVVQLTFDAVNDRMLATRFFDAFLRVGKQWSPLGPGSLMASEGVDMPLDLTTGRVFSIRSHGDIDAYTSQIDPSLEVTTMASPELGSRALFAVASTGQPSELLLYGGVTLGTCPADDPFVYQDPVSGSCIRGDTWHFDGSAWDRIDTPTSPGPRIRHDLVYDAAHDRVVLLAGSVNFFVFDSGDCPSYPGLEHHDGLCAFRDAWAFEDGDWSPLPPPPVPSTHSAAAYDTSRGEIVFAGGVRSVDDANVDSWQFDGSTWKRTLRLTDRPFTFVNDEFQLARHPPTGKVIFRSSYGEVMVFEEGAFTASPNVAPGIGCSVSRLAYEPSTEDLVLVDTCQVPVTTWRYDIGTDSWTQAVGAAPPDDRRGMALAWHAPLGRMVLYGGAESQTDTWSLDGDDWVLEAGIPAGPAATYHQAVTDGDGNAVMASRVEGPYVSRLTTAGWTPLASQPGQSFTALTTSHSGDPIVLHWFGTRIEVLHDGAWSSRELEANVFVYNYLVPVDDGSYLYLSANDGNTVIGVVPPAEKAVTALVGRFPFYVAGGPDPRACLDDACPIDSVEVRAVAGPGHTASNPLRLSLYDPRGPVPLAEGTGELAATITDDDVRRLGRIFATESREVVVSAASTVGRRPDLSPDFVDVDYLEVRVRYRQP